MEIKVSRYSSYQGAFSTEKQPRRVKTQGIKYYPKIYLNIISLEPREKVATESTAKWRGSIAGQNFI